MQAIQEMGLVIPDDIGVIGYDGVELCEVITPTLSTIDTNLY